MPSGAKAPDSMELVLGTAEVALFKTVRNLKWSPANTKHQRKKFLTIKSTLAGRSPSRRMKYGNHSFPNGT